MPKKRQLVEVRSSVEAKPYTAHGVTKYLIDTTFVTDDGMPVRLQKRGFDTRGEAIVWAEREIVMIKTGAKAPPSGERRKRKAKEAEVITTREVLHRLLQWWHDASRMKDSTISISRNVLDKYIIPVLGETPWREITQTQIDQLVKDARGLSSPRHLLVLRSALRDSHRIGIEPPRVQLDATRSLRQDKIDFLTFEELDVLCSHAEPVWAASMRFLFHSGLRIGELMGLQWDDIDLRVGQETLTVKRTVYFITGGVSVQSPKSGKQRTIPLNQAAVKSLKELARLHDSAKPRARGVAPSLKDLLVLPGRDGGYLCSSALRRAVTRARVSAGLRHITPHTFRHSFASHLVMAGVDLLTVARLLGHSSVEMTMRYAHLSQEGIRAATGRLDELSGRSGA